MERTGGLIMIAGVLIVLVGTIVGAVVEGPGMFGAVPGWLSSIFILGAITVLAGWACIIGGLIKEVWRG